MQQPRWNWPQIPAHLIDRLHTPEQREVFQLLLTGMTQQAISKQRGCAIRNTCDTVARIKKHLLAAGHDPENGMTVIPPASMHLAGRSQYVRTDLETGEPLPNPYWNIARATRQELGLEMLADKLAGSIVPYKPVVLPKTIKHDSNLMAGIFIGDAHIGMYAYQPETKHSDFNVDIATEQLRTAIDNLIERAPDCEIGLLVNVGDFLHADTSHNKTFAGTELDVDTRYERILDIAADTMHYAIDRMLRKFKRVIVVNVKGNHDPNAAVGVQKIVAAYWRLEKRVDVLRTASHFHYIEWGRWLFGMNHGDKIKAAKLPGIMARDMSEAWGRTTSRMWILGHFHHQSVLELDGCVVQKFAALPPPDAWHSSMGYSSIQAMQMIIFRKTGGKHSTMIYELDRPVGQPDLVIR